MTTAAPAPSAVRPTPRIGVVVNNASGGALGDEPLPRLLEAMAAHGVEPVCAEDAAPSDIVQAIDRAVERGIDRLVLFGGDGTIAAAAAALVGRNVELALVPGGTMNLLAQNFSIPVDPAGAIELAMTGTAREIDVGDVNGELFLVASVLGLPAQIQQAREAHRASPKPIAWLRLALAAVDAIDRYPSLRLEVDLGEGRRRVRTRTLCITGPDVEDEVSTTGELGLYILRPTGRWRALWRAVLLTLGRTSGQPGLVRASGDRFVVDARASQLQVMNDGEIRMLEPPLVFAIRRRALKIVAP